MSEPNYQEIEIPSDFHRAKEVEDRIIETARRQGYPEDDLFALRLSLEEALANAIRHGNGMDKSKQVALRYYITPERIDLFVADQGRGFNPASVPDPTAQENLRLPNGRGIMLMRAYMNLVEYNDRGNVVHMVKLKNVPVRGAEDGKES